jgi:NADH:ubiquinone oxidoreductase subunit H
MKLETRLATVLGAALFVTLFLGAGSIPFVDSSALVPLLSPFVGEGLPTILLAAVHVGAFLMKWLLILGIAARMKRVAASARDDRALRLATRRLLPLAWANLLLVTAVALWFDAQQGGLG